MKADPGWGNGEGHCVFTNSPRMLMHREAETSEWSL